jgi:hypothetical protein
MTIRLIETAANSGYVVDRPPKGYPKGDVLRSRSILRNAVAQFERPQGAVVGSETWITTVVIAPFGKLEVKVVSTLPGGTIRARGTVTAADTTVMLRVVGGTGMYVNARGTLNLRNLTANGRRGFGVYRLQLP